MIKRLSAGVLLVLVASVIGLAQNSNSSTTSRPRTTNSSSSTNRSSTEPETSAQEPPAAPKATPRTTAPATPRATPRATPSPSTTAADTPGSPAVVAAFNKLLDGIRKADVDAVSSVYWNSPRLVLFNNNGSVTKGWDQMRRNRETSYKDMKDVKLTTRALSITMLGRDGAVVSCLWTQSQTFRGEAETATGRMTLVFRRVGKDWKAIHLHTSPSSPEPARVPASEKAVP